MGSWNTMAMRVARISRRRRWVAPTTSSPSTRIEPALTASTPGGSRPMTASDVTDLPEPDSPTTHTVSPACTSRLRLRTTRLPAPATSTDRLRMASTADEVSPAGGVGV